MRLQLLLEGIKNHTCSLVMSGKLINFESQNIVTMLDIEKLPPLAEENPIGMIFTRFPELNVRQVARSMGINEALMQHYVNGVKRPSFDRAMEIERFLHKLGEELMKIEIK
jgi:hypothetical protein